METLDWRNLQTAKARDLTDSRETAIRTESYRNALALNRALSDRSRIKSAEELVESLQGKRPRGRPGPPL